MNDIEDEGILQIEQGEHIKNLNYVFHRLTSRNLAVKVIWPDGSPAKDATIYVAYEHTLGFAKPRGASVSQKTDQDGLANLRVFGDSRIRLLAEGFSYVKLGSTSLQRPYPDRCR